MRKQDAIVFAKKFGWTAADAKRALINIDIKEADEQTLLLAMANFAGKDEKLFNNRDQAKPGTS